MPTTQELYNQAEKLKDEGQTEEAVTALNDLLSQDDSFALAHLALAVLYGQTNKHEDAVRHGERACQIEPEEGFNFTALSVTYQRAFAGLQDQKFIKLAEDAMEKAARLNQRGPQ